MTCKNYLCTYYEYSETYLPTYFDAIYKTNVYDQTLVQVTFALKENMLACKFMPLHCYLTCGPD